MQRQKSTRLKKGTVDTCNQGDTSTSGGCEQKILILPKNLLNEEREEQVIRIRDPKSGNGINVLVDKCSKKYFQLMKFQSDPSSFFIDNMVQQDGSLTFVTEIDPLFLVLPYLTQSNKYRPLEQVLVDKEFPDCTRLNSDVVESKLLLIAKVKEIGDMKVYCYDWEKCKRWLLNKVDVLIAELKNQKIPVSNCGAQIATFIRNSNQAFTKEDYKRYAHGMISEFIPKDIETKLFDCLGLHNQSEISEKQEDNLEPPAKKLKSESRKQEPTEDYFDGRTLTNTETQKKKLNHCQRALSKVDKTGMKSISSFFKKV